MPLTVSPFVSLPTATTLPYTYKSLPPSLPPPSTADQTGDQSKDKPKFVVSSSGQAAHPDDILSSCQRLAAHAEKLSEDAKKNLEQWERSIQDRELAEKRRVAPGWLDRNERILQPELARASTTKPEDASSILDLQEPSPHPANKNNSEADDLDRAFGSIKM